MLGFQDDVWSRLALPALQVWEDKDATFPLVEPTRPKDDSKPKALSCYRLLRADTREMLLRFVEGGPVSQITEDFWVWVLERLKPEGKRPLLIGWDKAPCFKVNE